MLTFAWSHQSNLDETLGVTCFFFSILLLLNSSFLLLYYVFDLRAERFSPFLEGELHRPKDLTTTWLTCADILSLKAQEIEEASLGERVSDGFRGFGR